jgi:catechol 2,3-dioxygenase-like lactoylglutathione lyase family enzyme
MITLLFGCFQVELTVRDLEAARKFMVRVLGARGIEQQLARDIQALLPDSGYRVDHLDCGEATFQVNQPAPSGSYRGNTSVHQANLDRIGPCVSNLNFYVDDIGHARALLTGFGCPILTEGPSTAARSLADYGPGNTRSGGGTRPFLFVGTRGLIGLDLELMEPNFKRFTEQTAQYPCFVRPGEDQPRHDIRLERLRIAVKDLDVARRALVRLFAPASLSRPYEMRAEPDARALRLWLGGIELEYSQPKGRDGKVAAFLSQYGPGVMTIEFSTNAPDVIAARAENDGSISSVSDTGERWLVASRALVGFDVGLIPRTASIFAQDEPGGIAW